MTAVNQILLCAFENVRKVALSLLAISIIFCFATEREHTKMSTSLFSFMVRKNAQPKPCVKVSIKQPYSISLRDLWSLN